MSTMSTGAARFPCVLRVRHCHGAPPPKLLNLVWLLVCQRHTSTVRPCPVSNYSLRSQNSRIQRVVCSDPQQEIKGAPFDSISSLQFSPASSNLLLASAWDSVRPLFLIFLFHSSIQSSLSTYTIVIQTVRLYDIAANEEKTKFDHRAAVLSTTFSDASHAYSGGLDASLREYGCPAHC